MRYSNHQYAEALYSAMEKKTSSEQKKVFRNFLEILRRRKETFRLKLILASLEKIYFKKLGVKKISLEYPEEKPPVGLKKSVEKAMGRKVVFQEKTEPSLLAGVKILINDEILIDATAKRQLDKMFIR